VAVASSWSDETWLLFEAVRSCALLWHRIDVDHNVLLPEGHELPSALTPLEGVSAEINKTHGLLADQPSYLVRVGTGELQAVTFQQAVGVAEALVRAAGDSIGNVPAW
jgi:hypothetical protein